MSEEVLNGSDVWVDCGVVVLDGQSAKVNHRVSDLPVLFEAHRDLESKIKAILFSDEPDKAKIYDLTKLFQSADGS
jgi:hypothetical protein